MKEYTEEIGKTSREVSNKSEEESSTMAVQNCWRFVEDDCDRAMDCIGYDKLVVMFKLEHLKKTLEQEG